MRRSSYLKTLTDVRARAAHHLARAEKIAAKRAERLAKAEAAAARCRTLVATAEKSVRAFQEQLASCDCLLLRENPGMDPKDIASVRDQVGRYGGHGGFGAALKDCLRSRKGAAVSTKVLARELMARLGLVFELPALRKQWRHHTLAGRLHYWVKLGLVEHVGYEQGVSSPAALWRWKADDRETDEAITARLETAGVRVVRADAADYD